MILLVIYASLCVIGVRVVLMREEQSMEVEMKVRKAGS